MLRHNNTAKATERHRPKEGTDDKCVTNACGFVMEARFDIKNRDYKTLEGAMRSILNSDDKTYLHSEGSWERKRAR